MIPYNPGGGNEYDDSAIYLELSKKANKAELADKADKTELLLKADISDLELKADVSDLELKADVSSVYSKTDTDDKLLLKADISSVYSKTETDNKLEANTLWVSDQIYKNNSINENIVNSTYIKRNNGIEINNDSYSDLIFLNGYYYGIHNKKLWKFNNFNDTPKEIIVEFDLWPVNYVTCLTKKNDTTIIIGCWYYIDGDKYGHSFEYNGSTFNERKQFGENIPEKMINVQINPNTYRLIVLNDNLGYNYNCVMYSSGSSSFSNSRTPDYSNIKDVVFDPNDLYKIYLISETGLFYGTYNSLSNGTKLLDGNCTSLTIYNDKPVVCVSSQIIYDSEVILNDSGDLHVLNDKLYVINKNRIYNLTDSKMINYDTADIVKTVIINDKIYILKSDKIFSFSSVDEINYELINVNTAANDSLVIKSTTDALNSRLNVLENKPADVTKDYVDTQDGILGGRITTLENKPADVTKNYVDTQDGLLRSRITDLENKPAADVTKEYVDSKVLIADPNTWKNGTLSSSGNWQNVIFGNNKFVAVSSAVSSKSDKAAYSYDGLTWYDAILPYSENWIGLSYGNNKFVTIAYDSNNAAYSSDGITWIGTKLSQYSYKWSGIAYGNDKFVCVANKANVIVRSDDGINWFETAFITTPGHTNWDKMAYSAVTYGNDKFVYVGSSNQLDGNIAKTAYSSDGNNWTESTIPSGRWHKIVYGNNKFVTIEYYLNTEENSSNAAYSSDGINWTTFRLPISGDNQKSNICFGDYKFVVITRFSPSAYSVNGMDWFECSLPLPNKDWRGITYGNNKYIVTAGTDSGTGRNNMCYSGYLSFSECINKLFFKLGNI